MATEPERPTALGDVAARQLANATKTTPQLERITPRWLTHLLNWVPVEAGIYRLNRVKDESKVTVECSDRDERELPQTFVDYQESPREYMLSAVNTVVDVHTRVSDLYSVPHNQIGEQLRLTIEIVKERQESELINNKEYGMLQNVAPAQRITTRSGAPTPDDLDELLTKVWKEPGFFLAHPSAIAAFRPRMHPARRAATHGFAFRLAIHHLAWRPAHPFRQDRRRGREDQHLAHSHRRKAPGCHRLVSAEFTRPAEHGPFRSLHGNQPQGDCFLFDLAVLLAGGSHRRRAGGARRRGDGNIP